MAPKAPPVYRPQPTPKVLQTKAKPGLPQTPAGQKATAVYRPQPTPRVLQRAARPAKPLQSSAGPPRTIQAKRPPAPSRSNTIQAMFVDPMPTMQHQWQPGIGVFFDPNCGWYCQIAAIKHWVSKLHLTCPPDVLPKTSLLAYSPWNEGASLAKPHGKPTTARGWEILLNQRGPLVVSGKIGGADWGPLGGVGHFVLIVGADAIADTISYLDPLQGNSVKTEDFQHVFGRMTSNAYSIKVNALRRLCDEYEAKQRGKWLDDLREKWESRTTDTVNDSNEGSLYVTNDML